MDNKQKIKEFNRDNAPLYLVDHENGEFSLCLSLSFLPKAYDDFGQSAFNRYAGQIGDPIEERGLYTHGCGYEWESVFKKAFESDANLSKISFDCEAGGFFCYAGNLSLLADLGSRFRTICMDEDGFGDLVCKALEEGAIREAEKEKLRNTLRGFFMECPESEAEIRTPDGDIRLTAEQGQQLLNGTLKSLIIGDTVISAEDFLEQEITHIRQDLFHEEHFQMKTMRPEETIAPIMSM